MKILFFPLYNVWQYAQDFYTYNTCNVHVCVGIFLLCGLLNHNIDRTYLIRQVLVDDIL